MNPAREHSTPRANASVLSASSAFNNKNFPRSNQAHGRLIFAAV